MVKPLSRLKRITVCGGIADSFEDSFSEYESLPQSFSVALVDMLERRMDDTQKSLVFETEKTPFDWAPDAEARLERLRGKGYDVRIVKGFEEDLWMM